MRYILTNIVGNNDVGNDANGQIKLKKKEY